MITIERSLVGVNGKLVTLIAPPNLEFPSHRVIDFGTYCGAGPVGDRVVPDTFYGLKVSPACFIHDVMWAMSGPNWTEFHQSNSVFLHNLNQLVIYQSNSNFLKRLRLYRAATYYNAVDTKGAKYFWKDK